MEVVDEIEIMEEGHGEASSLMEEGHGEASSLIEEGHGETSSLVEESHEEASSLIEEGHGGGIEPRRRAPREASGLKQDPTGTENEADSAA
jgi:hypothetical protein